jgi:hypothetical protein
MTIYPFAFANALGLTSATLAIVLIILRGVAPSAFVFIFNAQFFGADVASLLTPTPAPLTTLGELTAFVVGAWAFGLLGAVIYNRLVKGSSRFTR